MLKSFYCLVFFAAAFLASGAHAQIGIQHTNDGVSKMGISPAQIEIVKPNASKGPQGNDQLKKEVQDARTIDAANKAKEQAEKSAPGLEAPKQDDNLQKQGAKYTQDKKDAAAAKKAAEEKEKKKKSCLSSCTTTFKVSVAKFSGMCNSGPNAICKPEIYEQYKKVKEKYEACKQGCEK